MPDILLIQPPIKDFYLTKKRTIPYGLACLAAALEKEGFSVGLFDALATSKSKPVDRPEEMGYLEPFFGKPDVSPFALFHQFRRFGYSRQHIKKIVKDSGAFMVGISALFTAYSAEAMQVARTVKSVNSDIVVVMGGHHATALPEAVMASEYVDFAIRGEAEAALPALARAVQSGRSPDDVPGIVFRGASGRLTVNDPVWEKDLDLFPAPALHLIRHRYYKRGPRGSAVVVASRGCPLNCSYCAIGSRVIPYRKRSVAAIIREIELQVRRNDVGFIDFEDENLSTDRRWFMALLETIHRCFGGRGIELRAMNGLFPPALDDEMVGAMRRAGFKTLNLALGTTAADQLKRFNRPNVSKAFDAALNSARRHGLAAVGYVIVGAPDQTAASSIEDLLYLAGKRVLAGVSVFYPAPGSREYERCRLRGLLPDSFGRMRAMALPLDQRTSRIESVTLLRLGRILNFMKQLRDDGVSSFSLRSTVPGGLPDTSDRRAVGLWLLRNFFSNGEIGGLTPDGKLYAHTISTELSRMFIEGLNRTDIEGVSGSGEG